MIPSTNNKLLVAEDWKKIYQSFKNADFKSYDFETLRRTMITYLRENYPEKFNDYIDSSEYIALIDLIAYLGQNLSFRIDLNARDNFLETAERRDSILRLAQLVSYNPNRNIPASGLLKIVSVSTSETVYDTNGTNLSNTIIGWNDPSNNNWYQQFVAVINAAISQPSQFGKPLASTVINGITTDQYRINSSNQDVPVYSFIKNVSGVQMGFEIVSSTFAGKSYVYEETPKPANQLGIIFQNDSKGSGSNNTGFFVLFKQGALALSNFTISTPVPNELIGINADNINNTDVWLWQMSSDGLIPQTLWTKVDAITGNNVIYNSVDADERNFYAVLSRNSDQIDLSFADGSFGNLPKGVFSLYYRQSNALSYSIKPEQMSNITLQIPYTSRSGQSQTLNIVVSLQYTVSNSAGSESNDDIKLKAPQTYYTQNRMVTGEDYNIAPLNVNSDIIKVKSINRVSSGISKYYELSDVSGAYSQTDIFASDGLITRENKEYDFQFSFTTRNEIFTIIKQQIEPIINSPGLKSFYLNKDNYPRIDITTYGLSWVQSNVTTNQTRGYFTSSIGPTPIGSYGTANLQFLETGSLVKFTSPSGYFTPSGKLTSTPDDTTVSYIWVNVANIIGDGCNGGLGNLSDGTGPVILTNTVPSTATPTVVIPPYDGILSFSFETEMANLILAKRNFGLSFDNATRAWYIISDTNLNLVDPFSLAYQKDVSNTNLDSSWMMSFQWTGKEYDVRYRTTEYVFESQAQTAFFVDNSKKNYDFVTDTVIKDKIEVLGINKAPTTTNALGTDYAWQIDSAIMEPDGYIEPKKVLVSFYDYSGDGQLDDPDAFDNIVAPDSVSAQTEYKDKFVYFLESADGLRYSLYTDGIVAYPTGDDVPLNDRVDGQLYYFYTPNVVQSWSTSTYSYNLEPLYYAKTGRRGLKFHYLHNTDDDRRLDPSKMNIIDVYLLSRTYDLAYRTWLSNGSIGVEPLPPTSQSLENNYAASLEPIKSISDELVYHPAKYVVLFGSQAAVPLQAIFKAVQSSSSTASPTSLQSRIISAINDFFAVENWDFGQTFNFGELVTYVMNIMTPDITNLVIVPKSSTSSFGSLFQITCQSNEIFISGATVNDVQILNSLTASELNTTSIVTSV